MILQGLFRACHFIYICAGGELGSQLPEHAAQLVISPNRPVCLQIVRPHAVQLSPVLLASQTRPE